MSWNEASRWRLEFARERLAPVYASQPKIAALLVGGSASLGMADRHSDLELGAFWLESPTDDERRNLTEAADGCDLRLFGFENGWWSEDYSVSGLKIDLAHTTVETVELHMADVLERFELAPDKHNFLSVLQHAIPLHGSELLERWRDRVAVYPDELARRMVAAHVWLTPAWGRERLAERGDLLALYENVAAVERRLLLALLGLNRVYLPHPSFKWLERLVSELAVAPADLARRLRAAFRLEPAEGVEELHRLVEEVFALVEVWLPEVGVAAARGWFRSRRLPLDGSPD